MRTRRIRRAIYKIEKLLITDGVKEDSHLWKSWIQFKNAFVKKYKRQWIGEMKTPKKRRVAFEADPEVVKKIQGKK